MNFDFFDLMKGSFTILVLLIGSILSLKVVIEKYFYFKGLHTKLLIDYAAKINTFIRQGNLQQAYAELDKEDKKTLTFRERNPLKPVMKFIIERSHYERDELLQSSYIRVDMELASYEKGLGVLATLGAVSPFIGLFGTVIGIIRAFSALSVGDGNYTHVMAGIAEALIATAAGILVAIPSVMFYNYFIKRIKLHTPVIEEVVLDLVHNLKKLKPVQK